MKKNNLLQRFEYAIVPAASTISRIETSTYHAAGHLPLMQVSIDFENSKFSLEGDWQFLVVSNRHASPSSFSFRDGRVKIEADIYPGGSIDLDDRQSDGLVVPLMGGIINERSQQNSCSGFIVVDKKKPHAAISEDEWEISFYLYDSHADDCEIKYNLPVYGKMDQTNYN
ncbi:MAG TPA: hypothetical protein VK543_08585 [Puia sp.]|nr:hypothetical protein [Puia sp.]